MIIVCPHCGATIKTPLPKPLLTVRQLEVLSHCAQGQTNYQIGRSLSLSPHTIHNHLVSIYLALGVQTRTQAVLIALRNGLLKLDTLDIGGGKGVSSDSQA